MSLPRSREDQSPDSRSMQFGPSAPDNDRSDGLIGRTLKACINMQASADSTVRALGKRPHSTIFGLRIGGQLCSDIGGGFWMNSLPVAERSSGQQP